MLGYSIEPIMLYQVSKLSADDHALRDNPSKMKEIHLTQWSFS